MYTLFSARNSKSLRRKFSKNAEKLYNFEEKNAKRYTVWYNILRNILNKKKLKDVRFLCI